MPNIKALAVWAILFFGSMLFLSLAISGRLGILAAIAILPDNVAYTGK